MIIVSLLGQSRTFSQQIWRSRRLVGSGELKVTCRRGGGSKRFYFPLNIIPGLYWWHLEKLRHIELKFVRPVAIEFYAREYSRWSSGSEGISGMQLPSRSPWTWIISLSFHLNACALNIIRNQNLTFIFYNSICLNRFDGVWGLWVGKVDVGIGATLK